MVNFALATEEKHGRKLKKKLQRQRKIIAGLRLDSSFYETHSFAHNLYIVHMNTECLILHRPRGMRNLMLRKERFIDTPTPNTRNHLLGGWYVHKVAVLLYVRRILANAAQSSRKHTMWPLAYRKAIASCLRFLRTRHHKQMWHVSQTYCIHSVFDAININNAILRPYTAVCDVVISDFFSTRIIFCLAIKLNP